MDKLLKALRAAGEPTRLRLLAILAKGELTVTELTQILRQSQPRVSRHLKLLCEAGLLDRFPEGSWVFYKRASNDAGTRLAGLLTSLVQDNDPVIMRDLERLEAVRQQRAARAGDFFRANADQWSAIRSLHVPEAEVEQALAELSSRSGVDFFVDLGTGTGRILELLGSRSGQAVGIDLSPEMLAFARAHLEQSGMEHCSVRQGDLYDLALQDETADLVTLHQVLHYLDEPATAVREAARILKPGGRLLIADFAPHELDFLRDKQAHRRLGFSEEEVRGWLVEAGLDVDVIRYLPPESGSALNEEPQDKNAEDKNAEDGGAKLTVIIYAADKPRQSPLNKQDALQGASL